jgi:hypothetical protein
MKCDDCEIEDETVEVTVCPFVEDVYGQEIECVLCRSCYEQRSMAI